MGLNGPMEERAMVSECVLFERLDLGEGTGVNEWVCVSRYAKLPPCIS